MTGGIVEFYLRTAAARCFGSAMGLRCLLCLAGMLCSVAARADTPNPVLNTIFPAGGQAGTAVDVTAEGSALDGLTAIRFRDAAITSKKGDANRVSVSIPAGTPPGTYDARAVGMLGVSSPRSFVVSNRTERLETEPNDLLDAAERVPLDCVINGRIDKPGDVDCFRFAATAGQRIVLECRAERIDSRLRGILELYDAQGVRVGSNRGYARTDPLIDFVAPASGEFVVKLFDLTYSGSPAHVYRLDIDTGPRVEFAIPGVLERGKATRVALFGRNLVARPTARPAEGQAAPSPALDRTPSFDRVEVDITPPLDQPDHAGLRLLPAQLAADAFPYHYPRSDAPVLLCATDVPVIQDAPGNHSPGSAREVSVPCEVSGQLAAGDEQDWYAVQARRGDVLWLEAFGERIGSPVDLDIAVLDASGLRELEHFSDALENSGGYRLPLNHLDPAGRWVAPADGRFLIMLRNLTGGLDQDPRRVYRLSVRREEPDFHLAVVSRRTDQPAGANVCRNGREMLEVLAVRHRGLTGPIRITTEDLPAGMQCPDVWLGPGVDRVPLIVTAGRDAPAFGGLLKLRGHAEPGGTALVRKAAGGTMIWPGQPTPSGRLIDDVPLAAGPDAALLLTATSVQPASPAPTGVPGEALADQDSVLEVAVDVERRSAGHAAALELSAVGLPDGVRNELAVIEAGQNRGVISFHLPGSLAPGPYTFAVQGTGLTESPGSKGASRAKPGGDVYFSNPITVRVAPARMTLAIDPHSPRKIARGKIIQLGFSVERKHGFIGKVHTELKAPGGVVGLRGRGVTLVGQTDSGSLQVIATDDAPLGRQSFLRLEAVGTVEDQPLYRASRFVELEITE